MTPEERLILLHELLAEFLEGLDELEQSGEKISDEMQGEIADEIALVYEQIDQLQQQQYGAPSSDAQLLWILSGQDEQAFISYLRSFPSSATNELLANPSALAATIDQLSQMMPNGVPEEINGITHADLNSSNIWGSTYNPKTRRMKVRFQGGSEYEYDGVPANIYRAFSHGSAPAKTNGKNQYGRWWENKMPSLGAAMNQFIKAGGYKYRKLR